MRTKYLSMMLIGLFLMPVALPAQPRSRHTSLRYQFLNCPALPAGSATGWAAGVAMMVGWKENTCPDILSVLQRAGEPYLSRYNSSQAVSCEELFALYDRLGMTTVKAFEPAVAGWRTLLAGGPVLTTLANYSDQGHVLFVNRLYEDSEQDRTDFGYFNPASGQQESLEAENFRYNYGTTAAYCNVHFAYWPDASLYEMFELLLGARPNPAAPGNLNLGQ